MHTPSDWRAGLLQRAMHYAVCEADASDLVQDCLHAYQRRFGSYPWEHAHTQEDIQHAQCWCQQKLRSLATDRATQPSRQCERLLGTELFEYLAVENPEEDWIWHIAMQQFIDSLPTSLQKVAVLYNQGYEYAEIASALNLSVGSVKQYLQRIKRLGRAFFGLDVNKLGVCVVNRCGSPEGVSKEVLSDEETQGIADERVGANDSELGCAAEHPCCPRRTQRGGVKVAAGFVSGQGCGCSGGNVPLSMSRLKQQCDGNHTATSTDCSCLIPIYSVSAATTGVNCGCRTGTPFCTCVICGYGIKQPSPSSQSN